MVGGLRILAERFSEGGGFRGSKPPRAPAGSDFDLSTGSSMKSLLLNILISGVETAAGSDLSRLSSVIAGRRASKLSILLLRLDSCEEIFEAVLVFIGKGLSLIHI